MEQALWYLFVGTRGGSTRVAIVRAIDERPRNANQLAEAIEMDYNTVRHHLEKLAEHDVIERGRRATGPCTSSPTASKHTARSSTRSSARRTPTPPTTRG
jgi:DNA-binding transcriptional ArsR family regulator